jgi:hypothetical protein
MLPEHHRLTQTPLRQQAPRPAHQSLRSFTGCALEHGRLWTFRVAAAAVAQQRRMDMGRRTVLDQKTMVRKVTAKL